MSSNEIRQKESIHQQSVDLVYGYIRNEEKIVSNNIAMNYIPTAIIHLCLLFYYIGDEYFAKFRKTNLENYFICISDSKNRLNNTIKLTPDRPSKKKRVWGSRKSVYGNVIIDTNNKFNKFLYIWTFEAVGTWMPVYFGIHAINDIYTKFSEEPQGCFMKFAVNHSFAYKSDGNFAISYFNGHPIYKQYECEKMYCYGSIPGNVTVEMQLNTADHTLKYIINSKDCGYIHDEHYDTRLSLQGLKYCMAVCLYDSDKKVKLVNFVQRPI